MAMLKRSIKADGLLPPVLEQAIAKALTDEGILVDPVVTVVIAEYHSRPISVAGAVRSPITFQAEGPVTLLQAIAKAGGFEKTAGTEILVTHGTDTVRVPVKELIDAANTRWNLPLRGGEEVRVPEAGRIFVVGNVKKPGSFSYSEMNDASVLKALALAEGLMPFSAKQAFIYRADAVGAKHEVPVDLNGILQRKAADVAIQRDDVLYIPDNKNRRLGTAALERILLFGSTAGATALIYSGR
jgi:polysaccharide export outer membrane protein